MISLTFESSRFEGNLGVYLNRAISGLVPPGSRVFSCNGSAIIIYLGPTNYKLNLIVDESMRLDFDRFCRLAPCCQACYSELNFPLTFNFKFK